MVKAERAADAHDPVTHDKLVGVTDLHGGERGVTKVGMDHGDVTRGIGAHDRGIEALAVQVDRDVIGTIDHMVVRDDVAAGIQDDPRAESRALLVGHVDGDDGGQVLGGTPEGARELGYLDIDHLVPARAVLEPSTSIGEIDEAIAHACHKARTETDDEESR